MYQCESRRWLLLFIICYTGLTNNMLFNGFGNISDLFSSLFDLGKKGQDGGVAPGGPRKSTSRQKGENVEYVGSGEWRAGPSPPKR